MNLSFLLPSALAALAAIALPLLVHLSRRVEQKRTDFAALRWLRANLRPRRKLLLQERVLLALRILLLIALALYLAQPVLRRPMAPEHWVMVVPGAEFAAQKNLPDAKKSQWHWLAPGFPPLEKPPVASVLPVSSLLRELDAILPASTRVTVLVPVHLSGLDAERTQLSRSVDWRIVPGKMLSPTHTDKAQPIKLAVRFDAAHAQMVRYFQASLAAWQSNAKQPQREALDSADSSTALPKQDVVLVWLASGELPENLLQWIRSGGSVLLLNESRFPNSNTMRFVWHDVSWRSAKGDALLKHTVLGSGQIWQWQQQLTPQTMPALLEADFAEQFRAVLSQPLPAPTQSLASLQKPLHTLPAWPELPTPISTWLVLVIALLFLAERWLASTKNRWATP